MKQIIKHIYLIFIVLLCLSVTKKKRENLCLEYGKYKVIGYYQDDNKINFLEDSIQLKFEYRNKRNYNFTWILNIKEDKSIGLVNFKCLDSGIGMIESLDSYKMLNSINRKIENTNAQKLIYTSMFSKIQISKISAKTYNFSYTYTTFEDSIKTNYIIVFEKD